MLTTSKKPQFNYLRRIMVLPLLAVVTCLFAFKLNEQNALTRNVSLQKSITNFKLVVDAGHGGKDYGAANNDVYEKDIVLKIAKEIKALSSQYGIDVVLTRNDDEFQTPQQKSDFANNQNANAFVSIHVNNSDAKEAQLYKGIEVVISEKNKMLSAQSLLLGSSIIQNLTPGFDVAKDLHQSEKGVWVLNNSKIPAALIECGYLSNTNDLNMLQQDDKIELMAKNILQGVAMYANDKNDKSGTYNTQETDSIILPANQVTINDSITIRANKIVADVSNHPLYIINGKESNEEEFKKLNSDIIESISVMKDRSATKKYGDKGKNGVIKIDLKN